MIRAIRRSARRAKSRCHRSSGSSSARNPMRGIEVMEPRRVLSIQPVFVGSVYVEEDLGSDLHGDTFYLSFEGGAPGTQLTHVEINGDQNAAGFAVGDVFFDTNSDNTQPGQGRFGADDSFDFEVISQDGIDSVRAIVDDGGSLLRLEFDGFEAGDRLVFAIDVDEVEDFDPLESDVDLTNEGFDPVTSGVEFQSSSLIAGFSADSFEDLEVATEFRNRYDDLLEDTPLDLPADDEGGQRDRTAGAVGQGDQIVIPATLSGSVFHDRNQNGQRDPGEEGLAGVDIQAVPLETVVDQTMQTVSTDPTGRFEFDELMPGRYRLVQPDQPDGFFDGLDSAGTVNGTTSGTAVNPGDLIDDIVLPGGGVGVDYDFGEYLPVTLRGRVHLSTADGDCFGSGIDHEALANVQVRLLDEEGQTVSETITDASGQYEFIDLQPGIYTLVEVTPAGLFEGDAHSGLIDSQRDERVQIIDTNTITNIRLNSGQDGIEFDFCERAPASLQGFVYHDQNNNRQKDSNEQGVADVVVRLLDPSDNIVAEAVTGTDGSYQFTELAAGDYRVVEVQPTGWLDGLDSAGTIDGRQVGQAMNPGDRIEQVVLGWGQTGIDYNFGELLATQIFGSVHLSTIDGDCFGDDELHEPIGGVVVQLLDVNGQIIRETTTDAQGNYAFRDLAPGRYGVREITPSHLIDGGAQAGTINGRPAGIVQDSNTVLKIVLGSGEQARDVDFCEHAPAVLSGNVYHDRNNDGRRQDGEEAIGGVTLILMDAAGTEVRRVRTDDAGTYRFDRLDRGRYRIVELQPDGWNDGLDTAGSVDGKRQGEPLNPGDEIRQVVLGWGQAGVDYNFGELRPSSLSGRVHADLNADCELQENESTLSGVTIELLDSLGRVIATQTTDANGEFRFTDLEPGEYTLRQIQPEEYFSLDQKAGSGGGNDETTNLISQITISSGQDLIDYRFCEEPPSAISGFVFQDGPTIRLDPGENLPADLTEIRDGQLTPDDRRLDGVVIELRHGVFGTPIDGATALPGYYPDGPIRAMSNADGFFEFRGLHKGNYSLYEIQPAGLIDSIDTNGTVPGIAINPHELDKIQPQVMAKLRHDPNFDAIVRIALFPGVESQDNLFSEIQTETPLILPSIFPAPAPVPPPISIQWEPLTFVDRPVEALPYELTPFGRMRGVVGSTWHLSVLDGGTPRGQGLTVFDRGPFWHIQDDQYRVAWNDASSQQMYWVMVVDGKARGDRMFGMRRGIPIAGDFNGDGLTEIGVFIDGQWFVDLNGNGRWDDGDLWARMGHYGDQPVVGDWDGDGKDDIGIFGLAWSGDPKAVRREPGLPDLDNQSRGGQKNQPAPTETIDRQARRDVRVRAEGRTRSDVVDHVFHFGVTGHLAVSGDWNGDGIANIGVFDKGVWHLDRDGDGKFTDADQDFTFGHEGDIPIAGDFNGDGIDEVGILSNGRLVLDINRNFRVDAGDQVISVGHRPGQPVVGDWNGDGVDDVAMTYEELRFVEVDARE